MPEITRKVPAMIGIDVGGANVKIVAGDDVFIHYCPLWAGAPFKKPPSCPPVGTDRAAVVMSGELADCFLIKWRVYGGSAAR